jgi:glutathione peroxidase
MPQNRAMQKSIYDVKLDSIRGGALALQSFRGKTLLFVNTASECGYTPQYAGLEKLYQTYKDRGLVVIGVPANEFGAQEPGTNAQIQDFCETRFHVTFPMTAKQVAKGDGKSEIFRVLTEGATAPGDIKWNFEKFLVGGDGQLVQRFGSKTEPQSTELKQAIEAQLKSL